jgi:hypothetical protein
MRNYSEIKALHCNQDFCAFVILLDHSRISSGVKHGTTKSMTGGWRWRGSGRTPPFAEVASFLPRTHCPLQSDSGYHERPRRRNVIASQACRCLGDRVAGDCLLSSLAGVGGQTGEVSQHWERRSLAPLQRVAGKVAQRRRRRRGGGRAVRARAGRAGAQRHLPCAVAGWQRHPSPKRQRACGSGLGLPVLRKRGFGLLSKLRR